MRFLSLKFWIFTILATSEAEIRKITSKNQPGQKVLQTVSHAMYGYRHVPITPSHSGKHR
jgi:hypothetical protein